MQVRKVAVVATGALATAAVMGSTPAFAADSHGATEVAPAVTGVSEYQDKHRASDEEMRQRAEQWLTGSPEQGSVIYQPQPLLSIGSGSAISLGAQQDCGSDFGYGPSVWSPNVVRGDCDNGNILIKDNGQRALISILDRTAISLFPSQACGSDFSDGYSLGSPNAVLGDCSNGNIAIGADYTPPRKKHHKKHHRYETGEAEGGSRSEQVVYRPQSLLSIGSGSAVSATQACGSDLGYGLPSDFIPLPPVVPPPVDLPEPIESTEQFGFGDGNLVKGDCDNGNILIKGQGGALVSILDGSAISLHPLPGGLPINDGLVDDVLDALGDLVGGLLPIIGDLLPGLGDLLPGLGDLLPLDGTGALPVAESESPQTEQFGFSGNLVKGDCSNGNIAILD